MGAEARMDWRQQGDLYQPGRSGGLLRVAEAAPAISGVNNTGFEQKGSLLVPKPTLFTGKGANFYEEILDRSRGGRFLIVTAHPDDEIMMSGAIFRLVKEYGMTPDLAVFTLGEKGTHNGTTRVVPETMMRGIRELELMKAADFMGVPKVHFFDQPDGGLKPKLELALGLAEVIRETKPAAMFIPSDENGEHDDHVNAVKIALMARYFAAMPGEIERNQDPHLVLLVAKAQTMKINTNRFGNRVDATSVATEIQGHYSAHASQLLDYRYEEFTGDILAFNALMVNQEGVLIAHAFEVSNGHINQENIEAPRYHPVVHPKILEVARSK